MLAQFCAVSGAAADVDAACDGYAALHTQALGSHKSVVVRAPAADLQSRAAGVELAPLTLQQVFVALCGHEQEGH